jgi:transcriptional regulator with XRE-family HTH domain
MKLGGRIKRLREDKGWSQNELQRVAGLPEGLVSRLERDIGNPSLETLSALAGALGVTVSELVEGL